jgi:cytochrome P450
VSVVFDPFRPEHRRDPYPHYHEVRAADPVQRHPLLPVWVLTRYADVLAVLRDPRFSVDRTKSNLFQSPQSPLNRMGEGFRRAFLSMMLFRDPPDHTRLRHLVNKVFTPRMIESLRPRIQHIVDDLLTALARAEEEGDRLSADELFAMCVLILVAGPERRRAVRDVRVDPRRGTRDDGEPDRQRRARAPAQPGRAKAARRRPPPDSQRRR